METSTCLDAAIKYATKYGWAVFPCRRETKRPLTPHGCKDAKKDVGAIQAWWRRWPDASIGIATGKISRLIVIDEDVDEDKGLDGIDSVRMWELDHGALPETATAITGRGGYHLYYTYDGDDIGNRAGLLEGVDVRGEGGYVIAPPSVHPRGTLYEWEYDPDEFRPVEADEQVLKLLKEGKTERAEQFHVPDRIETGKRNDVLYKMACSMQAQGYTDKAILDAVSATNAELCDDPLDPDEIDQIVKSALRYKKGELKAIKTTLTWHEPQIAYQLDKNGLPTEKPVQAIYNAEEAITFDKELFGRIRYNEIAYAPYVYGNLPWRMAKGWREWTNADDTNLLGYIEKNYGIKNAEKVMAALNNVAHKFHVNPIKDALNACFEDWDGNKHIENLLPSMLGVEKNEYTCTAMRLFMLGAIMRIFRPGCKFDYMLVLVGDQGAGKSSFLRKLTMNDAWFHDNFNTLDGSKAFEALRGMWIVEMAELQATKRAKDVESIKSFITSQYDTYRAPYERRTEQRPRMCVLAGTSNKTDFLTDKTGNRRFLPITCNEVLPTIDIFRDEMQTAFEIRQAWGEAMNEYHQNGDFAKLVLPKHLQKVALAEQAKWTEEDTRIGAIQDWLDKTDKDLVCARMLYKEALEQTYTEPTMKESREINEIMRNNVEGWEYIGKQRVAAYGIQRAYKRIESDAIWTQGSSEVPFE